MKIALLNMPVDGNYGGHLQRYALMMVLANMGHDVVHLNRRLKCRVNYLKFPLQLVKRLLDKYIFNKSEVVLFSEFEWNKNYVKQNTSTDPFYERYINHTAPFYHIEEVSKHLDYDCFLVGSDQVWRKSMAWENSFFEYFFDYLPDNKKRCAYAASFGIDSNELNAVEIHRLKKLYKKFFVVSVREDSALDLLSQYGCLSPKPIRLIDPTLLLQKSDYDNLIDKGSTYPIQGDMFCYILDKSQEKINLIEKVSREKKLLPFFLFFNRDINPSVEQWLRYFRDAKMIITDSYHGFIFSIIFNKPFILLRNAKRGNSRFETLFKMLNISDQSEFIDWSKINKIISQEREKALDFLKKI